MKKRLRFSVKSCFFIFFILFIMLFSPNVYSAEVSLAWDANTEPDLAGYKIYYGTASGSYQYNVDVGNQTTYTVTGLSEGVTYYFAAVAYDVYGNESGFSNEVFTIIDSGDPVDPGYFPGDWNSDGTPDILWRNYATGDNYLWYMDEMVKTGGTALDKVSDTNWVIAGTADFNGDKNPDILWRNYSTGDNYLWYMDGAVKIDSSNVNKVSDVNWAIDGVADFNLDGKPDILWRNYSTGNNYVWYMDDCVLIGSHYVISVPDVNWVIEGVADFNGDGNPDIMWRNYSDGAGDNYLWYMDDWQKTGGHYVGRVIDTNWEVASLADMNTDGKPDIMWRNYSTGYNSVWYMSGWEKVGGAPLEMVSDTSWYIEE